MSIKSMCQRALEEVPMAVGAGAVDLETGLLLGAETEKPQSAALLDLQSRATQMFFQGEVASDIDDQFKSMRGDEAPEPYCEEIVITSRNMIHILIRTASDPAIVATVVCRADANLGLALSKFRRIAAEESI